MVDGQTGFLEELKRRKVFRVAVAYIVIAWVALQFFDLVLDNIDAPAWVMQTIMALLAVGFPITVVLAWAFDVSADGVKTVPGKSRAFALLVVVLSVASLGYVGWSFMGGGHSQQETSLAKDNSELSVIDSIAVLPFENFSGDQQDEYFADGLADTLLHKLAQIKTLKVIARNSSFQFKGSNQDVREIGRLLGVAALLEGSVQRQGSQVRIIAQLIDTANGSHIWSETFDDSFQNIFELQDRIAQAIIMQLRISISQRDRELTLRNGTSSPEAYELLMRAHGVSWADNREAFDPETDRALALVDQALEIDPNYAQAWETRSGRFISALFAESDTNRSVEYITEARRAAERAIEADPEYVGGYLDLAWSYLREYRFAAAEENFLRAFELAPTSPDAMRGLGQIKRADDPQLALDLFTQARELDPQAQYVYRQMAGVLIQLGRLDESVEIRRQGVQRFPANPVLLADLAGTYLYGLGNPIEAARWASQIVALDNQDLFGLARMSQIWAAVGDVDRSAEWHALYAGRFPNAPNVRRQTALIAFLTGDAAAARLAVESIPESPNFRFDRATPIAAACMVLDDRDCVLEQASKMAGWLADYEAAASFSPSERYRMAIAVLENAVIDDQSERDLEGIGSLLEASRDWPITGGRGDRYTGYLHVMLAVLLGNDDEALLELHKTLDFENEGFLYRDIFRMPPDFNPVITRLAGTPGYAEWLREFTGRREHARGSLVQMERDGEIIAAADVDL